MVISMENNILKLLFTLVVAFLTSYAATPAVKLIARKMGAMDEPKDGRRMHKKAIPRLGGLAIYYGFIVSVLCFAEVDYALLGVLLGSVVIVTVGVFDDMYDLPAWFKLLMQIVAAGLVVMFGTVIEYIENPLFSFFGPEYFHFELISVPITIIWIVGVTNAVNLIDGLDGLAVGVSSVASASLFCMSLITQDINLMLVTAAVAGAGFGFLPYNMYPASIFMGDTGATFLGFILSTVSIMGLFKSYAIISFAVPILILAIPIFDTLFAVARRLLKGKSPIDRKSVV